MKNKLIDLNDHLFTQLERLCEEDMTAEQIEKEVKRTEAVVAVSQQIGTERISKDGYLERKVHDGLPMQSRWQLVQRIEWEAVNGSIPDDHCLKCLDGDKLNTSPNNWALIPRAVLPLLSGRHGMGFETAEPEVKPAMMTIAKLKHAARKAKANRKDQVHG